MAGSVWLEDSGRSSRLPEVCFHSGATHIQLGPAPWGWLVRMLGGVPVDRRAPHSLVTQMAEKFKTSDYLVLAVPPEGTRSKVDVWKSGFYHIASQSSVPIGLAYLDYQRKLSGLGMFVIPSGNITKDMDKIRAFYRNIRGKHPELESEPRLQEES